MATSRYTPEELQFNTNSQEEHESDAEQTRTRIIFEEIKNRALNSQPVSTLEADFFCEGVVLSRLNDGSIEDYLCCDDFNFKWMFYIYGDDFTGGSRYRKPLRGEIVELTRSEVERDLKYLSIKADEWLITVNITNHSEEALQYICKECRDELKIFNASPEWQISKGFRYDAERNKILFKSKFNYIVIRETLEKTNPNDLILNLNGQTIEINSYSLSHIMNRHYLGILQGVFRFKTIHCEDFYPRELGAQLKNIISQIDSTGLLNNKSIDKVAFILNGNTHVLWTSMKTKSVAGQGNIPFRRLDSFYRVTDPDELLNLSTNFTLSNISTELQVYVPI